MKTKTTLPKTILIFILLFAVVRANALEIQLSPTMYAGGYNISCHGSNNGAINTYVLDGTGPFTFVWSNGATSKNISNLTAGAYTVTVTASNGETATGQIDLIEPELFIADLTPEDKGNGYQISEFGGTDGNIHSQITGGVPPYTFLWSNGATTEAIDNLTEGTYTLVVHDATNCITTATVTLLEPTELHLVSITSPKVIGNYNIGCSLPGSISVNIAGGIPPYTYEWDNGGNTQTLNDLFDEGDYGVLVRDENGAEVRTNIILTKSPVLSASVSAFVYSNNKNTSCYNCNNGSINTTISSGTSPYIFVWNNGASVKNPNNLSAGVYSVIISDAAGCTTEKTAILLAPEREDWTMNGNTGTNPTTQYIGTSDNKDLVFKRMNVETMRFDTSGTSFEKLLTAKGGIALNADQTFKISYDNTGTETTVSYGSKSPVIPECDLVHTYGTKNEFPGSLKTWTKIDGTAYKSALSIGSAPWNGSGMIELNGTNELGDDNVLTINYFCGRDVAICTNNTAGGYVSTGRHFEVGGPWPFHDDLVAANIRGTSQTGLKVETVTETGGIAPTYNTYLTTHDLGTKILGGFVNIPQGWDQEVFNINSDGETYFGSQTAPAFYIKPFIDGGTFQYINANIGIGTNNPQAKLQVDGNVKITNGELTLSNLANSNNQSNLVQSNSSGQLSVLLQSDISTLIPSVDYWKSTNGGNDLFHLNGNVGIGTNEPRAQLQIGDGFGTNISLGDFTYDWNVGGIYSTNYIGFNATRNPSPTAPSNKWTLKDGAGA